ncbi:TonB-dependent receptor [Flavihumibacter sp. CACIAM 22H1]|uniref:TonB-dependent receptor plug domain-containing protein n=1 Tax=Flavihumibacter sp. CACIAM 22H1 TaxID=1812911 RepID=UPI0007A848FD|nr:TonB-dependent receptor [Flavihumibacter sp. CACIAM 22H1]KYP14640.1 MAG: TonB-dependent receptor [Flavihumibacter sp. CACIAM 22H1]
MYQQMDRNFFASRLILLTVAVTGVHSMAVSQEKGMELDPVTVTASVNPIQTSRTGRNVFVIKGDRFMDLPVQSVDELLRFLPGVEMQLRGPAGSQADIVIRGGSFQQVLVLLDGMRLNDPNTGHFSAYIPLAPAEIDRIEILKGAGSAIYGAEAVGGVVHIITRTYAARAEAADTVAVQAQGAIGEYKYGSVQAGAFIRKNRTAFSAGILSNHADGQLQRGTRGFFHNNTVSLSGAQWLNDRWKLSARVALDDRDFGAQNFYTTFASDTAKEKIKSWWTQLQVQRVGKKDRLLMDIGYKHLVDEFAFNKSSVANRSVSELVQAQVRDEIQLTEKTGLTAGMQFISKKIASNDRGNHTVLQGGAFLVMNQQLGEHWMISPALRLEWNERSNWEWVPQVNISYRAGDWQLRGSGGKTIRDADFTERFNNYNRALVTGGRIGNPDLNPERSWSYELGADYFVTTRFKLAATYFQRFQEQLIDWTNTPYAEMPRKDNLSPTGAYALAKNIARVNTRGVELDGQYRQKFGDKKELWLNAGLTWIESKGSESTPSLYLSSHARWLSNLNAQVQIGRFYMSVGALYKYRMAQQAAGIGAVLEPDYFLFNGKLQAAVWQARLRVFVQVDNIFDVAYQDLLGSVMPGRWVMGGLSFRL